MGVIITDELYHYGVKGMKWGIRRQHLNSGYSSKRASNDRQFYGKRGVKSISKRMDKGESYSTARKKVEMNTIQRRSTRKAVAWVAGAAIAGMAINRVANSPKVKAGKKGGEVSSGSPSFRHSQWVLMSVWR